ncbi:hypothetical protein TNCV_3226971 [Trichonephila clavipes]|nr:hypothetical protein TNCV_3226971 [Trichonephila clavipes]
MMPAWWFFMRNVSSESSMARLIKGNFEYFKACCRRYFRSPSIVMEESWIHQYDPETKVISIRCKKIVILTEYLENNKTITSAYYYALLNKWRDDLINKCRNSRIKVIHLLTNNESAHTRGAVEESKSRSFEILSLSHHPILPI